MDISCKFCSSYKFDEYVYRCVEDDKPIVCYNCDNPAELDAEMRKVIKKYKAQIHKQRLSWWDGSLYNSLMKKAELFSLKAEETRIGKYERSLTLESFDGLVITFRFNIFGNIEEIK